MYNLEIYPIFFKDGVEEETLPGLISLTPPRKCARGREADQLIAFIHLTGNTNITPDALKEWLEKKAALFYSVPGSVTSAMRMMAEAINNELLDRNLKKAAAGSQVNGSLNLVAIRKDTVYSLVIGQSRLFLLTKEDVTQWIDQENHLKGLGVNQSVTCLFNQNKLSGGELLLIAPLSSPYWNRETLQHATTLQVDALGRRLMNQRPPNLKAALVRLMEGKGTTEFKSFFLPKPKEVSQQIVTVSPAAEVAGSEAQITAEVEKNAAELQKAEEASLPLPELKAQETQIPSSKVATEAIVSSTGSSEKPEPLINENEAGDHDQPSVPSEEEKDHKRRGFIKALSSENKSKSAKIKLPNPEAVVVPRHLYLLLAIAVPIIVVIVAASVYINQGRTQQFSYYLEEGRKYAQEAELSSADPVMHSFNLQAAVMYLQKARQFGSSEESTTLLTNVQAELDKLQGVVRLAMTPLESDQKLINANITQMVATNTDLYMLDSISGKALHFDLVGEEYIHDKVFDCGPNPNNPLNRIGKLVDIIALPSGNSFDATLLGIDAYGNIEFCIPDDSGVVSSLIAPDAGWQEIKAISMYQNYLYVLDPGNNGVFMYYGSGILFEDKPVLFFDNVIPDMDKAVDIEVYADELYVLRSNGEMVECTYSHLKDYKLTECTDPAIFFDTRSGQDAETVAFPDSQFVQMRMTPAPDSSLYLLDAHGNGIYHFSLLRNLQKILQPGFSDPEYSPKETVTSVAFTPGRKIFMAFGNEVYTATIP